MNRFRALGALMGAGLLTFAIVGTVAAAGPTYTINVTKSADPSTVPVSGSVVTFTISVENTGTGDFHTLGVVDTLAGCTVAYASGDTNTNSILDGGETWNYTCSVAGVTPETENTATVHACHNSSPACTQANQTTSGESNTVVVGLCESDCVVVTPAPTVEITAAPTLGASIPPTDTAFDSSSTPGEGAWLLIIALGAVLGSVVVLRPSRIGRTR